MLKLVNWRPREDTSGLTEAATSLDAFGSEKSEATSAPDHPTSSLPQLARDYARELMFAVPIVAAMGLIGYGVQKWSFRLEAATASLTIESEPAGADVLADGVRQGATPLTMSVTPGEHAYEIVSGGRRKGLRAVASAGAAVVHHVQFAVIREAAPTKAALKIVTEPANLRVLMDGQALGFSPLTAADLEPGAHRVQVAAAGGMLERKVVVAAGENMSVIISAAPPSAVGPSAGWLTVDSAVPLHVIEGDDIIGTSESPRIMLTAGKHELRLANDSLGVSDRRVVDVKAGTKATIRVDVPSAPLSINALPWAEAWINGKRVGETPIGNYMIPVGTHEVVFRHPDLGERRQSVTVSLKAPARVAVDMRRPQQP